MPYSAAPSTPARAVPSEVAVGEQAQVGHRLRSQQYDEDQDTIAPKVPQRIATHQGKRTSRLASTIEHDLPQPQPHYQAEPDVVDAPAFHRA